MAQEIVQRRRWHWSEWIMLGFYAVWVIGSITTCFMFDKGSMSTLRAWEYASLLVTLFMLPLLFWRPGYVHMLGFPLTVLLTVGGFQHYLYFNKLEMIDLLSYPLIIVGFLSNRLNIWWTVPCFLVFHPSISIWLMDQPRLLAILQIFTSYGVSFVMGLGIQRILTSHLRMKQLYGENVKQYDLIRQQNKALEQYARQVENLTLLEERNRLARELHDTVGHTFTSVIMGMDAVSYLIELDPNKAKAKLEVLREVTRNGLDEVRKSIHQIAPLEDNAPLTQQISRLANEFAVHTGTSVRVDTSGEEGEFPQQLKLTIIRCLQEALTNAKRHGQAASVLIEINYLHEQISLKVKDDGLGSDKIHTGFGLNGMKERLAAWRGNLQIHSHKGLGTTVTCTIPYSRAGIKSQGGTIDERDSVTSG